MINLLVPKGSKRREFVKRILLQPRIPVHIRQRYVLNDDEKLNQVGESLKANYFSKSPPQYLSTSIGKADFADHLTGRLESDRQYIIPWMDRANRLAGTKILEIGCGTGASTVALVEQGGHVTAIDIDELALKDAALRCRVYGFDVDFIKANATELSRLFDDGSFDMVIFYASLEHMTHDERIKAIGSSWKLLAAGGQMCVVDTPNRLAYFDGHTSQLPFYHWLPDDLAFKYSKFSPRETFNSAFRDFNQASYLEFIRWGRGVSYHEFELALDDVDLSTANCYSLYKRKQRFANWLNWRLSKQYVYETILKSAHPSIHSAFFQSSLNFMIQKPH